MKGFRTLGAGAPSAACGFADAGALEVELPPFSCCACAHPLDMITDNNATTIFLRDDDD
jgi:hypothetical protein